MKLGYRNTRCHWGSHIACLYQNEEERDHFLSGFMCRGLKDDDYLLYGISGSQVDDFKKHLVKSCPEFRLHIQDPDRINILRADEIFSSEGSFSTIGLDSTLKGLYSRQHADYHRNLRMVTEMSWLLDSSHPLEEMEAFEEELNTVVPRRSMVSVCLFNVNHFSREMILKALATHPFTISRGIMSRSSYYEPPTHYMNLTGPDSQSYGHATGF